MKKNFIISSEFRQFILCNILANDYEPHEIEDYLKDISQDEYDRINLEFEEILKNKPFDFIFFNNLTDLEIKDNELLYLFLSRLYCFSFEGGSLPNINDYRDLYYDPV
jgi:hypothetical protein